MRQAQQEKTTCVPYVCLYTQNLRAILQQELHAWGGGHENAYDDENEWEEEEDDN